MRIKKMKFLKLSVILIALVMPKGMQASMMGELLSAIGSAQVAGPSVGTTSSGSGYITGGNICVQSATTYKPMSLFSLTPPEMAASCSNFNFMVGSLNFINAENIVGAVKTAALAGGQGALVGALQVAQPQVAAVVKKVVDSMEKANRHSRNMCQLVRSKTKTFFNEKIAASQSSKKMLAATKDGGEKTDNAQENADKLEDKIQNKEEMPLDEEEIGGGKSILEFLREKFAKSERLSDLDGQITKYFKGDLTKTLRAICGDIYVLKPKEMESKEKGGGLKNPAEDEKSIASLFVTGGESDGGGVSNFKNLVAGKEVMDGADKAKSLQIIQFESEPSKVIEKVFEYLVDEIIKESEGSKNFFDPKENQAEIQIEESGPKVCVAKVAKTMLATSPIDVFHLAELSITSNEMKLEKTNFTKIMAVSFTESILMEAVKVMTVLAKTYINHVTQKMPFESFLEGLKEAENKIKSMHNQYQSSTTSVKDAMRIAKEQQRIKYTRAFNELVQKGDY